MRAPFRPWPGALVAGLLLAACAGRAPVPLPASPAASNAASPASSPASPPGAAPAAERLCRIGPDGGPPGLAEPGVASPVLASGERGIGGTGAPALAAAERGIGGTGVLAAGERGIGGTGAPGAPGAPGGEAGDTGIVGVVTGFASICVNGLHVGYDPAQPVAFADGTATPAALRVGQVVVVRAGGPAGALFARRIAVRHELAGTVEAVEEGALRVSGQRVVTAGALGAGGGAGGRGWAVGDAVLVSGLRAPDGSLTATRIDPRPAGGATLVFGRLDRTGGVPRIGGLVLRPGPGVALPPDGAVLARGRVEEGVLLADSVEPDRLMADPPAYLGVGRVLMEAHVGLGGGRYRLGTGLVLPAGPGGPAGLGPGLGQGLGLGRRVVELRSGPGGALSAGPPAGGAGGGPGGLPSRPAGAAGRDGPGRAGQPAPVPDRGFERRRGAERDGAGRWDGGPAGRAGPREGGSSEGGPFGAGGAGRGGAEGRFPGRGGGPDR